MGKVVFDISMSLDGFMTAAHVRPDEPLGDGGQRLYQWAFNGDARNQALLDEAIAAQGAVIAGRRTYDTSLLGWGADGPSGPARRPVFVVTHDVPTDVPKNGVYTFVTGGIERALQQAQAAAGAKTVCVMGGAEMGQEYIKAGLVDELSIHLVPGLPSSPSIAQLLTRLNLIDEYRLNINPVVLGRGKPYFDDPGAIKRLKLTEAKTFKGGVAALRYEPERR